MLSKQSLCMITFKVLIFLFFCLVNSSLPCFSDAGNETLIFRWTLYVREKTGKLEQDNDHEQAILVDDRVRVKPGQEIKFLFQPVTHSYIYLFLYSAENEMFPLFPGETSLFDNKDYTLNYYLFPPGEEWHSVPDTSGIEEFFLVVSNERQQNLEDLTRKIRKKDKKAPDAGGFLYEELVSLLQESCSPEIVIENFITLSGHLKGDVTEILRELTARKLYVTRFELVHEDTEE